MSVNVSLSFPLAKKKKKKKSERDAYWLSFRQLSVSAFGTLLGFPPRLHDHEFFSIPFSLSRKQLVSIDDYDDYDYDDDYDEVTKANKK